jgi:hypothetical protein
MREETTKPATKIPRNRSGEGQFVGRIVMTYSIVKVVATLVKCAWTD